MDNARLKEAREIRKPSLISKEADSKFHLSPKASREREEETKKKRKRNIEIRESA